MKNASGPIKASEIATFATAQKIEYAMLSDPAGAINRSLGIRDEQYPVGSAAFGVPRPTLYVLDRNGTIRLRYMEPTYRTRPDLEGVLRDVAAFSLSAHRMKFSIADALFFPR